VVCISSLFLAIIEVDSRRHKSRKIFRRAVEEDFFINFLNFDLETISGEL
jgi:hypothetical protein